MATVRDWSHWSNKHDLAADSLEQLLTGCPELTSLDLATSCVNQEGLDVLLALGTGLTHLGLCAITATEDRSDAAVRWEQLEVSPLHAAATAQSLAHLPLKTVKVLKPDLLMSHLLLPLDKVPLAQVPALLHKAATNLSACPAWQATQAQGQAQLQLKASKSERDEVADVSFSSHLLLQALAPVAAPSLKQISLHIKSLGFEVGRPELKAIATTLGSGLDTLQLSHCFLPTDFWRALDKELPSLSKLVLGPVVILTPSELLQFWSSRPPASPWKLELSQDLYNLRLVGKELQACPKVEGSKHHVSVFEVEEQRGGYY
jgi:hypothetical protein